MIQTEEKPAVERDDFEEPIAVRGQGERKRGGRSRRLRQHANESSNVWSGRVRRKRFSQDKLRNITGRTNHDLAFERQFPGDRGAKNRFTHVFTNDKRADGANVDEAEPGELFGDDRRLTPVCSTDIDRTKKDNPAHFTGEQSSSVVLARHIFESFR